MTNEPMYEIEHPVREKALLVGIDKPGNEWSMEASLNELSRLSDTAGAAEVGRTWQRLDSPNPKTFVGSGKAQEIAELADELQVDVVIFDDELSPSQQSNLERIISRDVKVMDRTALILDIFALHATTKEGRLQVKLAQNEYLYPRLRGMWAHLASNRMGGGVGSRFGEGESQLEVDRRLVRKRITGIKHELEHLDRIRHIQRDVRYDSGIYKVSLAGYTNAGKSSLLNALTEAQVYADDKLFATLDSTTRRLVLPEGREITLSDTVGFIQKLPTTLIEAFKSTLSDVANSDLLLHVIDASADDYVNQIQAVDDVLEQIGAQNIPRVKVFNKIDMLDESARAALIKRNPTSITLSAKTHEGITELISRIASEAASADVLMDLAIPYSRGDLVSLAHKRCHIISETHTESGTTLNLRVPTTLVKRFEDFQIN